jgi:hypothetical protein
MIVPQVHAKKGYRHDAYLSPVSLFALALSLLLVALVLKTPAQPANNDTTYTKLASFRIPFEMDGGDRQLQEVRLYVSEDQGRNWKKYSSVTPGQRDFNFRAEHDGLYWFTVQIVDFAGNVSPPVVQGNVVQQKVWVDTHPPVVTLRSRRAREGMVAVEWDIRDDNLDPSSFSLEYRPAGTTDWVPLIADPAALGERAWTPGANGPIEVRLRVRDLARNEGVATLTLTPGGQEMRTASSAGEYDSSRGNGIVEKRWVNSKHISLNYEIQEKGPSGVSTVELWWTRDTKEWKKYKEETDPKPPMVFDVYEEGVYGFTLIVKNGVGLGDPPPRVGDGPQIWVEVDLTKPFVGVVQTEIGRGPDIGNLTITWTATDKNLGREPITLSYAEDAKGTWTPIPGASNIENSGRFVWKKGAGPPFRFLVKAEAKDKAGNVGENVTVKPVLFDLTQPKSRITNVLPATDRADGGGHE